jgi:hypothetical protein
MYGYIHIYIYIFVIYKVKKESDRERYVYRKTEKLCIFVFVLTQATHGHTPILAADRLLVHRHVRAPPCIQGIAVFLAYPGFARCRSQRDSARPSDFGTSQPCVRVLLPLRSNNHFSSASSPRSFAILPPVVHTLPGSCRCRRLSWRWNPEDRDHGSHVGRHKSPRRHGGTACRFQRSRTPNINIFVPLVRANPLASL